MIRYSKVSKNIYFIFYVKENINFLNVSFNVEADITKIS